MTEKLTIVKEKKNPIFDRREIEVNAVMSITPKIKEAEEFIGKEFSANPENVKIKKIKGRFGSNSFVITANIYTSKEEKDKIETKIKTPRKKKAKK
ncbi:Ribosomal protein S24e [uncultured archaeon]|nr:Ribosomal protein S24e [uncultured archaeon]